MKEINISASIQCTACMDEVVKNSKASIFVRDSKMQGLELERPMIEWNCGTVRQSGSLAHLDKSEIALLELEYLKFMTVVSENQNHSVGMAGPVDHYWHAHILHTRDYQKFCKEEIGFFAHHLPGNPDKDDLDEFLEKYQFTLSALRERFGVVNTEVWPSLDDIRSGYCSGSCSSCEKG